MSRLLLVLATVLLAACIPIRSTPPPSATRATTASSPATHTTAPASGVTTRPASPIPAARPPSRTATSAASTAVPSPSPSPSLAARLTGMPATNVDHVVIRQLLRAGLPLGDVEVYTAETDPNGLIGQPGGYVSKLNFQDTRLEVTGYPFNTENGGSVEVFPTAVLATASKDYIQALATKDPLYAEYDYVNGPILLRLSKRLTPEQVAEYEQALKAIRLPGG